MSSVSERLMLDSERERREAVYERIIEDCAFYVDRTIMEYAMHGRVEEKYFLMAAVIERLAEKQRLETWAQFEFVESAEQRVGPPE